MKSTTPSLIVFFWFGLSMTSAFDGFFSKVEDVLSDVPDVLSNVPDVLSNVPDLISSKLPDSLDCTLDILHTAITRDVGPLALHEKLNMCRKVIGFSKRPIAFSQETDLSRMELLYRFSLYSGFTYCDTAEEIPKNPKDIRRFLPTGEFSLIRDDSVKDPEYQVTINDNQKLIVLSWRGSVTAEDWLYDLDRNIEDAHGPGFTHFRENHSSSPKCDINPKSQFFRGFINSMSLEALELSVDKLLKSKSDNPSYSVVITGHSLGGAKAMLFAYYISNLYSQQLSIDAVYTFGQPLLGNKAFNNMISDCIGKDKIIRAISENDFAPFLRREKDFDHAHNVTVVYSYNHSEPIFKKCSGPHDPNCGSSIPCSELTTAYHGWFGGLWFSGKQLCGSKL